jgi:hypothetical protein
MHSDVEHPVMKVSLLLLCLGIVVASCIANAAGNLPALKAAP